MTTEAEKHRVVESAEKDECLLELVDYDGELRMHLHEGRVKSYVIFAGRYAHLVSEGEIRNLFDELLSSREYIADAFARLSQITKIECETEDGRVRGV